MLDCGNEGVGVIVGVSVGVGVKVTVGVGDGVIVPVGCGVEKSVIASESPSDISLT